MDSFTQEQYDNRDMESVKSPGHFSSNFKRFKNGDINYEKYSIPFNGMWADGKYYKRITIENYGSGSHGNLIRNAVTGIKYNITVGSAGEDMFFKVRESTGRNGRRETLTLYYDSPEQFENHHFTTLPIEVKQKWHKRSLEFRK